MKPGKLYLIPVVIQEEALQTIPAYIVDAVKECTVFFVENERTARRFLKKLWRELPVDERRWYTIHKAEDDVRNSFRKELASGQVIGLLSEAGCPGVADPGQLLIGEAQQMNALVQPLVGPSSILLALMGSGLNGQRFQFHGYLPIDTGQRQKAIQELEAYSRRYTCTQLFIETPYRNNQMLESLLKTLSPSTYVCVACDLTGPQEFIKTRKVADWKKELPDLHKKPTIFLLLAN
ncbi:MAG: SAM-dependent methyltransferase [Chitinophagaceae bacterium]|nr:SAM-dependent methyltransferase [Chitinophagaceae bacterium]